MRRLNFLSSLIFSGVLSLVLVSLSEAQGPGAGASAGPAFAERKTKMLEMIDKRITGLQEFKSCVNSASEPEAIRVCREKHREATNAMQIEMEERRHDRRMERFNKKKD